MAAMMIRFLPDTWRDALLRPIAMAAPDAGVYVEIMAPDARFAFIAALVLIWAALAWRLKWRLSPVLVLLMFVSAAFIVWLVTTGNGRYFMPVLLAAGPLCIALIYQLPSTRGFRMVIAVGAVGVQAFIVYQNNPWHSWQLAPWSNAPFFEVTLDREALTVPSTYVTISSISYSLIAPRFPASSRWVNISSLPNVREASPDVSRMQAILAASKSLKLVIPSRPDFMTAQGLPSEELRKTINGMLGMQRLGLARSSNCRLLPSKGLASEALKDVDATRPATVAKFGFWVCALDYPVPAPAPLQGGDLQVNHIFDGIESQCSRFFQPGQKTATRVDGAWLRVYPQADIRLYVLDSGDIYYKYWRALNPQLLGTTDQLNTGMRLPCDAIRGRSGLPWEREI